MSNPQSQQRSALPPQAVDRLFARLLAIYGVQKVAAAWGDVDVAERNATWAAALGRFELAVIGDALTELAQDGGAWPPALPEFVDRCERHEQRPGRRPALPPPARTDEDRARGREHMAAIRELAASLRTPRGREVPPAPPAPACTCWSGSTRAETLCPACSEYARNRARSQMLRDGTAQQIADEAREVEHG